MTWKVAALAALLAGAATIAHAADFYVLDYDKENQTITLLDPSTIVDGTEGHRNFHLAIIGAKQWRAESTVDADCTAERWHLVATTIYDEDGSAHDMADSGWDTFEAGSIGAYMHDAVCNWPDKKPPDEQLYHATDFATAEKNLSDSLTTGTDQAN